MPNKKSVVVHVKVMGMTCCSNPASATIGITQIFPSSWAMGSTTNCPQDQAPWDHESAFNGCNCHYYCSRSCSCDYHNHRDQDSKPAAHDCRGKNFHVKHRDWSRHHSHDSQNSDHNCGHYFQDDDTWETKQKCSLLLSLSQSLNIQCPPLEPSFICFLAMIWS